LTAFYDSALKHNFLDKCLTGSGMSWGRQPAKTVGKRQQTRRERSGEVDQFHE